jgi:uncharacterized protein YggE
LSENSGRRVYYLAAVAIVAIVLISSLAVLRPPILQYNAAAQTQPKTLQVSGTGTVSANPDQAVISVAVVTQAQTATRATTDNAATMAKVLDALVGVGVNKDAIETTSYSLTPIYENAQAQTAPAKIVGYSARNEIQITLPITATDYSMIGKALDAAISAGANEVQGIMFTLSTPTYQSIQKQATQLALQDAEAQAKAIASGLGVSIVGPITVNPGYIYQPIYNKLSASAAQTPIQPGALQITATVQVTYEFA